MSNSTIPKLSPVLIGNLSAGYLQTGDLFVQVFPQMNPQLPTKVLVLVLSPTKELLLNSALRDWAEYTACGWLQYTIIMGYILCKQARHACWSQWHWITLSHQYETPRLPLDISVGSWKVSKSIILYSNFG